MTVHNYIQGVLREVLASVAETESEVAGFGLPRVVTIAVSTDDEGRVCEADEEAGRVCFSVMVVPKVPEPGLN
jgi:hypothetical protein